MGVQNVLSTFDLSSNLAGANHVFAISNCLCEGGLGACHINGLNEGLVEIVPSSLHNSLHSIAGGGAHRRPRLSSTSH